MPKKPLYYLGQNPVYSNEKALCSTIQNLFASARDGDSTQFLELLEREPDIRFALENYRNAEGFTLWQYLHLLSPMPQQSEIQKNIEALLKRKYGGLQAEEEILCNTERAKKEIDRLHQYLDSKKRGITRLKRLLDKVIELGLYDVAAYIFQIHPYLRANFEAACELFPAVSSLTLKKVQCALSHAKKLEQLSSILTAHKDGMPVLTQAAVKGNNLVLHILIQAMQESGCLRAQLLANDRYQNTALMEAAANGHPAVVVNLLEAAQEEGCLEELLKRRNKQNVTVLVAMSESKTNTLEWDSAVMCIIVKLGEANALVEVMSQDGGLALSRALQNNPATARKLLEIGKESGCLAKMLGEGSSAELMPIVVAVEYNRTDLAKEIIAEMQALSLTFSEAALTAAYSWARYHKNIELAQMLKSIAGGVLDHLAGSITFHQSATQLARLGRPVQRHIASALAAPAVSGFAGQARFSAKASTYKVISEPNPAPAPLTAKRVHEMKR